MTTSSYYQPGKLAWGRHWLPQSEATSHFVAVAATGGGKSTILQLLKQSALRNIHNEPDTRALIFDAKQDELPLLAAICPQARVVTAHPFDARGAAWDICRDVTDPAVALEMSFILVPSIHESQPFFSDAARHLLYGCMLSLMLAKDRWTLATLLRIMQSPSRIRRVLRRHPQTQSIEREYFGDPRLAANIMSTIATKLLPLGNVAAAWDTATETFSLEEWIRQNWILVLGNSETSRTPLQSINRCLFKRATDLVLNQSNSFTRRTWFLWDEVSEAGKLDGLVSLLKKGRSKGACCALAFQSVQGLRDASLYGPQQTDEILGQIGNRFFGRLECVATAEWGSALFGDQELNEETVTESFGAGGKGRSVNHHRATRRLVMPSELMDIPPCNRQNGLGGYYIVRSHGAYHDHISGDELWGNWIVPPDPNVPDFVPRPAMAKLLAPWSAEEDAAFCVRRAPCVAPAPHQDPSEPEQNSVAPKETSPPSPARRRFDDLDEFFQ